MLVCFFMSNVRSKSISRKRDTIMMTRCLLSQIELQPPLFETGDLAAGSQGETLPFFREFCYKVFMKTWILKRRVSLPSNGSEFPKIASAAGFEGPAVGVVPEHAVTGSWNLDSSAFSKFHEGRGLSPILVSVTSLLILAYSDLSLSLGNRSGSEMNKNTLTQFSISEH